MKKCITDSIAFKNYCCCAMIQTYFCDGIGLSIRLINNLILKFIVDKIQIMQSESYYLAMTAPVPAPSITRIPHLVPSTVQVAAVSS